jgi:hypothetical protein
MAHKKKGTYINHVNGKYYLYAAHSERIPGTKKVRRVSDGYIGRITEDDGLIPARDKVKDEVAVYECGLCMTLLELSGDIHAGLNRNFRGAADRILVSGILSVAYGDWGQETYNWSFLSIKFPELKMQKVLTKNQTTALERCERMLSDVMNRKFGADAAIARMRLSRICMVKINGKFYCSNLENYTKEWLLSHGIDWRAWHVKDRENNS